MDGFKYIIWLLVTITERNKKNIIIKINTCKMLIKTNKKNKLKFIYAQKSIIICVKCLLVPSMFNFDASSECEWQDLGSDVMVISHVVHLTVTNHFIQIIPCDQI